MSKPHTLQSFVIQHVFWKTKTEQSKIFLTFDTFDQGLRRQDLTNKNKLQKLEDALVEQMLTSAKCAKDVKNAQKCAKGVRFSKIVQNVQKWAKCAKLCKICKVVQNVQTVQSCAK